jgi:hypothetical protein
MSSDSINIFTVGLALFVICAGFVLVRGTLRILMNCLVLGISTWVGFRVWHQAPELVKATCGSAVPWLVASLPFIVFFASFILGRAIVRFLTAPLLKRDDERPPLTASRLLGLGFFALIPTCLVGLIIAALIYHFGSISELKGAAGKSDAKSEWIQSLKSTVEKSVPPQWLKMLDPSADPERLTLAKAISRQSATPKKPAIDSKTGKPIPRAVIVDDPELQGLAREGKFGSLLRHPLLTKALNDPQLKAFLKDLKL